MGLNDQTRRMLSALEKRVCSRCRKKASQVHRRRHERGVLNYKTVMRQQNFEIYRGRSKCCQTPYKTEYHDTVKTQTSQ
jgi:hypothetical protein